MSLALYIRWRLCLDGDAAVVWSGTAASAAAACNGWVSASSSSSSSKAQPLPAWLSPPFGTNERAGQIPKETLQTQQHLQLSSSAWMSREAWRCLPGTNNRRHPLFQRTVGLWQETGFRICKRRCTSGKQRRFEANVTGEGVITKAADARQER